MLSRVDIVCRWLTFDTSCPSVRAKLLNNFDHFLRNNGKVGIQWSLTITGNAELLTEIPAAIIFCWDVPTRAYFHRVEDSSS